MLFLTQYSFKPNRTKADMAGLMTLFAERGPEQETIAHYVRIDDAVGLIASYLG